MKQGSASSPEAGEPGYTFGRLRLESDGTLLRGGRAIHLLPKELAALRLLLAHAGQIVTPKQLKKALWDGVNVTADSIPRCVSSLRARLQPEECIQTIYKRGYRLAVAARRHDTARRETLPRLAIMPFATGFNVPEHLGAAIAEETCARLSRVRTALRMPIALLARDSVFTLAKQGMTAAQVGEALRADLVLTGSLRALPTHTRLRVEMIRVEDGTQIWVEDLIAAQTQVGGLETALVERLVSRMGEGGLYLAASAATENHDDPGRREAYALFQRGRHEWQTLQRERMQDGLQHLLQAARLDPWLIPAQVDLANASIAQAICGFMSPAAAAEQVRTTAAALPAGGGAEAILPALGWIRFHVDRDLHGALKAFAASAHLPHDPWTTRARTMFALSRRRYQEAIALLSRALEEDPYAPWLHARLGWAWHLAGERAKSLAQSERALKLFPEHEGAALYGAMILACNGEAERAVELAEAMAKRAPRCGIATAVHGYALACAGRRGEARTALERLQWLSRDRFAVSSFKPAIHVALGDMESAMEELHAADNARCPWFFQMLADPRLKALSGRPEFERMQGMLVKMEAAEAGTGTVEDPKASANLEESRLVKR